MSISINPYTGEVLRQFQILDRKALEHKIEKSFKGFLTWKAYPLQARTKVLERVGELLIGQRDALAEVITLETGKPITQARGEIEKCAWVCRYYAARAEEFLTPRKVATGALQSYVRYDPLGPVFGIMPWNYPFWQVFRFAVPALAGGNACLLKHAPNVWICAERIESLLLEAGVPSEAFQALQIDETQIEQVIASPEIRAVTLTGSTRAGAAVGEICGKYLKRSVMELGGSNALIIFPDADLDTAVKTCIEARYQNTGQSCIAGKRLLLHKDLEDQFIQRLVGEVEALQTGDPMNPDTYIGVMAREDLAHTLELQMEASLELGATLACGGRRKGTYFEPTVLTGVTREMPVFQEETFGPLLAVTCFSTEGEALALAQDTRYGLGVSFFTSDQARTDRLIPVFDEGAVFVNDLVKSDPRLPFGGVRDSGFGRELSLEGLHAFVNTKTVYINQ